MLGWMIHKVDSRLPGEISITSDTQINTILMAEREEELKSVFMKEKEESEKAGLKFNLQRCRVKGTWANFLLQEHQITTSC